MGHMWAKYALGIPPPVPNDAGLPRLLSYKEMNFAGVHIIHF